MTRAYRVGKHGLTESQPTYMLCIRAGAKKKRKREKSRKAHAKIGKRDRRRVPIAGVCRQRCIDQEGSDPMST